MGEIVRIHDVRVRNIKNVRGGTIKTNTNFSNLSSADVVGLYGQNGSGKTALVEAFSLLKMILDTNRLPEVSRHLMAYGQTSMELYFVFMISNRFGEYFLKYETTIQAGKERLMIINEEISYRENKAKKRYKNIVVKRDRSISIRNKDIRNISEESRVSVLVADRYATDNATSFVFRPELSEIFEGILNEVEIELMENVAFSFNKDFHVIDNVSNGLILANIMMPFSVHIQNMRGQIPYELTDTMLLPPNAYDTICKVIEQINIVLRTIVPGLQIVVNRIHQEKMSDGEDGIRFEFLSRKEGISLPLRCESAGILKIICILSTLIAVYNNANTCVIIDELDSGIFEYLLGELLEVIGESGKGQIFFTSHNLRILELLDHKSLWFTTMNEQNRFVQLKGVKPLSNVRDMYLRAVQLGGQDEVLYRETDSYDIKKSFRKAGGQNV